MKQKEDKTNFAARETKLYKSRGGWEDWLSNITLNHPLLTADEEIILGRQVQAMMTIFDQMKVEGRTEPTTKAEKLCLKRGKRAKDRFILGNVLLVKKVALKFTYRTRMPIEDLFQDGLIGLNRAAEKYDPERGYKFSTYAFWWIRQSMARAIGIQEYAIRLPGQYHEVMVTVRQFIRDYQLEHNKQPSFDELYAASGTKSKETFRAFMDRTAGVISLNQPMLMNGSRTMMIDQVVAPGLKDPYELINNHDNLEYMQIVIDDLRDPIQKAIMLNDLQEVPQPLTHLCREFNVSRECIRNKKKQAHNILRHHLKCKV